MLRHKRVGFGERCYSRLLLQEGKAGRERGKLLLDTMQAGLQGGMVLLFSLLLVLFRFLVRQLETMQVSQVFYLLPRQEAVAMILFVFPNFYACPLYPPLNRLELFAE